MAPSRREFTKLQRWNSVFLSVILLLGAAPLQAREPAPSFDIVITNGHIIDDSRWKDCRHR